MIQKPVTVVREEFIVALGSLINNSGLAPFVIEPILADTLREVRMASRKQYEVDLQNYNKSIDANTADNTTTN